MALYTDVNFKSKKALKEAVAAGRKITYHQPNGDIFGTVPPENGNIVLEGPHYPEPHRWYAEATVKDGYIVKVK